MKKSEVKETKEVKKTASKKKTLKEKVSEVLEVVVPADIPEKVEKAPIAKKKAEKVSKPKAEKKPATSAKKASDEKEIKPSYRATMGSISEDILQGNAEQRKTEQEKRDDLIHELKVGAANKEWFYGKVYGIEKTNSSELGAVVLVKYKGQRIVIPINEYFEPSFNFGNRFKEQSKEKQLERKITFVTYQQDAIVPFIVKIVKSFERTNADGVKEEYIYCVGSRREAMESIRDANFNLSDKKDAQIVQYGDTTHAHVISVKEDYIIVEAFGVETRILAKDLKSDEFIENCKDYYRPGDEIEVRVKKWYKNTREENGKIVKDVHLVLTGKPKDVTDEIANMQVGGMYFGKVFMYNDRKKTYTIHLSNGVTVGVDAADVQGGTHLRPGNEICVTVSKIKENGFIYGTARKLK